MLDLEKKRLLEDLFSAELERAVLGAVLTDPLVALGQIGNKLRAQSFYDVRHAAIWEAIQSLAAEGGAQAVSLLTVHERLRARGVDVPAYALSEIASEGALNVLHVEQAAELVLRLAVRRALVQQATQIINDARDGELETSEALDNAVRGVMRIADGLTRLETRDGADIFKSAAQMVERWAAEPGRLRGFSTGLPTLDRALGGLRRGQLVSVIGATGMGKSVFARMLVRALLAQGRVLWATTEMPNLISATMLAAERVGLTYEQVESGAPTNEALVRLLRALNDYEALGDRLVFLPDGESSVNALSARALTLAHQRDGLAAIVVDSASKLSDAQRGSGIFDRVTAVSNALQRLALRANVLVVATWQIGRNPLKDRDYRPALSDVKGSGAVEEDSDVVIGLYRRDYYVKRGLLPPDPRYPEGAATLYILKNRYGGSGGERVTARFVPGRGIVEEEVRHGESDLG